MSSTATRSPRPAPSLPSSSKGGAVLSARSPSLPFLARLFPPPLVAQHPFFFLPVASPFWRVVGLAFARSLCIAIAKGTAVPKEKLKNQKNPKIAVSHRGCLFARLASLSCRLPFAAVGLFASMASPAEAPGSGRTRSLKGDSRKSRLHRMRARVGRLKPATRKDATGEKGGEKRGAWQPSATRCLCHLRSTTVHGPSGGRRPPFEVPRRWDCRCSTRWRRHARTATMSINI